MEQPERVGNGILRASRDDIRLDEGAIRATVSFASANHFFGGWHANIGIDRLFGFLGLDRVRWSKGKMRFRYWKIGRRHSARPMLMEL
jgi:hypothetical protein